MEKISKGISKATIGLLIFAGFILFVSVFLMTINTICRKWLGFAILWCDELCQYAAIEACFFSMPYLLMHNKQLSVGLLQSIIHNQLVLRIIRWLWLAFELLIFFLMAKYCLTAAAALVKSGVSLNSMHIKKYIFYYIAEVSFILDFIGLISAPILNKGGFYRD